MTIELTATDLNSKGEGVARDENGKVYFIPNLWIGETAQVEVISERKSWGRAKIIKLVKSSSSRVATICEHRKGEKKCGGCSWLEIDYQEQVIQKKKKLSSLLKKIDYKKDFVFHPAESNHSFRNRVKLLLNKGRVGFRVFGEHEFLPIDNCKMLKPKLQDEFSSLKNKFKDFEDGNVFYFLKNNEIKDSYNKPDPFQQANPEQNSLLKEIISKQLGDKEYNFLELYCGSGNFTDLLIKNNNSNVVAADVFIEPESWITNHKKVKALKANLMIEARRLEFYKKIKSQPDALFLDPPRSGCNFIGELTKKFPTIDEVIYVSCSPESWLRDAKILSEQGFILDDFSGIDFFPNTPHIEIYSYFRNINN